MNYLNILDSISDRSKVYFLPVDSTGIVSYENAFLTFHITDLEGNKVTTVTGNYDSNGIYFDPINLIGLSAGKVYGLYLEIRTRTERNYFPGQEVLYLTLDTDTKLSISRGISHVYRKGSIIMKNFSYAMLNSINDATIRLFKGVDMDIQGDSFPRSVTEVQNMARNAMSYGLMFDTEILKSTPLEVLNNIINTVEKYYGVSNSVVNSTVISAFTTEELEQKVQSLLYSGMALESKDVEDLIYLISKLNLKIEIGKVKNREAMMKLSKELDLYPANPDMFIKN